MTTLVLLFFNRSYSFLQQGQTKYFFESSRVAYQIKADYAGSNMVANILPTDTPLTQVDGSKHQTISFSERSHVSYQIKRQLSTEHHESKYAVITHTNDPWGGVKRSFCFLFYKWSCCISN